MAAVATLLNPISGTDKDLLIFHDGIHGELLLSQQHLPEDLDASNAPDIRHSATQKFNTTLLNPSSLIVLQYKDLINVYGVVNETTLKKQAKQGNTKDGKKDDPSKQASGKENTTEVYKLRRLSPTYEKLARDITVSSGSIAGLVDSKGHGYLYYVQAKNHSQPYVAEYLLGESEDPETHDVELLRSTYLAASCYLENSDRGLRRIFYQATSKDDARPSLHMVQINGSQNIKQGSDTDLSDIKTAKESTPLAACFVKAGSIKDVFAFTYLYFVDTSENLCRTRIGDDLEAEKSVLINNAPPVAPFSQLAVSPGSDRNFVTYFTLKDNAEKLVTVVDLRK